MAIEILDLPSSKMVIFDNDLIVYQRLSCMVKSQHRKIAPNWGHPKSMSKRSWNQCIPPFFCGERSGGCWFQNVSKMWMVFQAVMMIQIDCTIGRSSDVLFKENIPKYPKDYHPHHLEFHPLSIPSHRAPQARSRLGIILLLHLSTLDATS